MRTKRRPHIYNIEILEVVNDHEIDSVYAFHFRGALLLGGGVVWKAGEKRVQEQIPSLSLPKQGKLSDEKSRLLR